MKAEGSIVNINTHKTVINVSEKLETTINKIAVGSMDRTDMGNCSMPEYCEYMGHNDRLCDKCSKRIKDTRV